MARLSRLFRVYDKKRGERRTGSSGVASLGEAFFFGIFFCAGCAALVLMLIALVVPEFRANRHFAPTVCEVLEANVGRSRPTAEGTTRYRPEIRIRYDAEGRKYEDTTYDITHWYATDYAGVKAVVDQFQVGQRYTCWYDPMDPGHAVVVRGYSGWLYLFLLVPISFIVIGSVGFVYTILNWNSSIERRAALEQANQIDLFEMEDEHAREFPTVPGESNLMNSPGTTLAYRLPVTAAPGWTLFAVLMSCLVWNGIVWVFVVMAAHSHMRGAPDWALTILIAPFVGIGGWLAYYLVRQLLLTTGVGATRVEISHHPLRPGEQYDIFLAQTGRLTMNALEVLLACSEKATYRQGTDTRTDTRRVYEERVFQRDHFDIHQGLPFETQCRIQVPASAMHSFKADHNEVNWQLIVRGNVVGWPDFERVFQVLVAPAQNGNSAR